MSYRGRAGERKSDGEVPHTFRQPDRMRIHSVSGTARGKSMPMIQSPLTRPLPWHVGIKIQDEIWVGMQSQTIPTSKSLMLQWTGYLYLLKIRMLKSCPLMWWCLEVGLSELIRFRWDYEIGALMMGTRKKHKISLLMCTYQGKTIKDITRKTALTRPQPWWYPDLRFPASRIIRNKCSLFKPPCIW